MAKRRPKVKRTSTFGTVTLTRAGNYRAYYRRHGGLHNAGHQFATVKLAELWLAGEKRLIDLGEWTPPAERRHHEEQHTVTFGDYADKWIQRRPLAGGTRAEYRRYLKRHISGLTPLPLAEITRDDWERWYDTLCPGHDAQRAKVYTFCRAVLASAVEDGTVDAVRLHRRGAGKTDSDRTDIPIPTPAQVRAIADAMAPEHRLAVMLAAYVGGMRFEEVTGLQRRDVHMSGKHPHIDICRANTRDADGSRVMGPTKTRASRRTAYVPTFLVPEVRAHLRAYVADAPASLLFPGPDGSLITPGRLVGVRPGVYRGKDSSGKTRATLKPATRFYLAAETVGRPDLHFHDLRHYFGTMLAVRGASLPDIMRAMGHTTVTSALKYQNAVAGRGAQLAAMLDDEHTAAAADAAQEEQPGDAAADGRASILARIAELQAQLDALPDSGA